MINAEALSLVKEFEGIRLKAYPDPGSKDGNPWTIGHGHTGLLTGVRVKKGDVITNEQAEEFLQKDLEGVVAIIKKYVKVELNENQYGALASFVFNIGEGQFAKSSVLKFINEGKLDSVPGRMALYRLNDGKVMAGLVRRRTAEGALWMKVTGVTPIPEEAPVHSEAKPDNPKKPWDWGAAGAVVTVIAGASDQVKKLVGNVTATFGIDPTLLLIAAGLAFAGWTVYSKWKDK
jgi:lysozyme